ncbi:PEP-CTERM sorting domain-containing protein [Paludibaculum fermentans]|uniref:PEP-CTERM sorting domain-containing protein n=1 Tax=Paludibaculum fermentans TaxID=1473598 RepID=UPI003EB97C11
MPFVRLCAIWVILTSLPAFSTPLYQVYTGPVSAMVSAEAFPGVSEAKGTMQVNSIPAGSTVKAAYLYTNDWFTTAPLKANFGSKDLGDAAPSSTDGQFSTYRWDVTGAINGNGSYNFDLTGGTQIYSVALAIVYSTPGQPDRTITLTDFSTEVSAPGGYGATAGTPEMNLHLNSPYGGEGTLWLLTSADDPQSSGEGIYFNAAQVGGPIDGNLGLVSSLFRLPVQVQAGDNRMSLTSGGDWFGWSLAILDAPGASTAVPEPASFGLALSGLVALFVYRRRRS